MTLCSNCKKNVAVVFVTKNINGKQIQEGLCLECAQKMGIKPIDQLMKQTGMTTNDIENLNKQMEKLFENFDIDETEEGSNSVMGFFAKAIPPTDLIAENNNNEDNKDRFKNQKGGVKTKSRDKKRKKRKYLDTFGTNLTNKANEDLIDRIIGREDETDRVIQILNRRTKNNPCLVGEPGVGKTAIAEGLAVKIAEGNVPAKLLDVEIYQLDMTGIVAGTQFRGQFESRMKGILKEAVTEGNIILVIDEIHNIMGAGEAEGAMNAANILKPALAKGEVQIIGATTLKEYRKYIEKDAALERRFQPVMVDEPTVEETIEILKGIKDYYEAFHMIKIPDNVIKTAAIMSERYINDRFLPDKAIDVIDEAGSRVNLKNETLIKLEKFKRELAKVREEKESAISADSIEEYQKAADLKVRECKLAEMVANLEKESNTIKITEDDVAHVIETWTKIPVQRITEVEAKKLINLEDRIHKRIIGQDKAVKAVSSAIRRSRSGLKRKKRPASFVFVGPTGVGKTELVKALAIELFESEEALIRLDMSEYMEKHTVSKLIGSPPGYIGYDEGGQLTEKIRRKPYSVILMDEIEKAHPDVFNLLLQIMEDGRLTDSHGRMVHFENTVVIMTSNAGTTLKASGIGFTNNEYASLESRVNDALKQTFRPEFLNRIDEVVIFTELSMEELKEIVKLMIDEFKTDIKEKNIDIDVSKKVREFILEKGYEPKYGARPLRRTIQKYIEDPLAEMFMKGEIKNGDSIKAVIDKKKDIINFTK